MSTLARFSRHRVKHYTQTLPVVFTSSLPVLSSDSGSESSSESSSEPPVSLSDAASAALLEEVFFAFLDLRWDLFG
jgi:hypothetical protein